MVSSKCLKLRNSETDMTRFGKSSDEQDHGVVRCLGWVRKEELLKGTDLGEHFSPNKDTGKNR